MTKDKFKIQFAEAAEAAFKEIYGDIDRTEGDHDIFTRDKIYDGLETPKDPKMGRFAFPVFKYAKLLKTKPQEIATKTADAINTYLDRQQRTPLLRCEAVGGFLNVKTDFNTLARETLGAILSQKEKFGSADIGRNRKLLVEYSSPNIAKPFGIGHLRSTVIGNSLRRIFKKLGYDVVGINYPGDWGTQFGKMIVAYHNWGNKDTLEKDPVKNLLELYVRFHDEAEKDDSLNEAARQAFRKLEEGDPETVNLWEKFKTISNEEFNLAYGTLGVEFDEVVGESFYNDKMDSVVARLEKAGLTRISRGALVVELDDPNLPPCLLKKTDGATLYVTRDLAGLIYRWEKYHFKESLYVVGTAQSDYFKQALQVIDKLETAENLPPEQRMTGRVRHIEFGWVKFEGTSMSTRRGKLVFLKDVIDQAMALAREKIKEKNPDLKDFEKTARMIGVGAVMFSQLSVRRQKDINFIWNEVLNFEGETGPYLQYTHARLCSLLRNYEGDIGGEVDYTLLDREEEQRVVELLADFPETVTDAARVYDPYMVTAYLLKLSAAFNKVYQRKDENGRIDKIISDDRELSKARVSLVRAVQTVVKEGLYLLGLEAPEEM
ncbi:MAG: arginine--tRNA ligase [candidate division Zixibacteria bacterium]|nr:arginine--tRNA ligase [candidate division Zixibacteria bacterium]